MRLVWSFYRAPAAAAVCCLASGRAAAAAGTFSRFSSRACSRNRRYTPRRGADPPLKTTGVHAEPCKMRAKHFLPSRGPGDTTDDAFAAKEKKPFAPGVYLLSQMLQQSCQLELLAQRASRIRPTAPDLCCRQGRPSLSVTRAGYSCRCRKLLSPARGGSAASLRFSPCGTSRVGMETALLSARRVWRVND